VARRPRITAVAAAVALVSLLVACTSAGSGAASAPDSTGTPREQAQLARYLAYAGPPIPYFTWLGHFYSWEPLGARTLVVFKLPNEAYLLKVWPPCDLRFDFNVLGVTSTGRAVYARSDAVTSNTEGTGPGRWRCPIEEIRKIDYRRLRADDRAQAQQRKAAGQSPSAPPATPVPQPAPPPTGPPK